MHLRPMLARAGELPTGDGRAEGPSGTDSERWCTPERSSARPRLARGWNMTLPGLRAHRSARQARWIERRDVAVSKRRIGRSTPCEDSSAANVRAPYAAGNREYALVHGTPTVWLNGGRMRDLFRYWRFRQYWAFLWRRHRAEFVVVGFAGAVAFLATAGWLVAGATTGEEEAVAYRTTVSKLVTFRNDSEETIVRRVPVVRTVRVVGEKAYITERLTNVLPGRDRLLTTVRPVEVVRERVVTRNGRLVTVARTATAYATVVNERTVARTETQVTTNVRTETHSRTETTVRTETAVRTETSTATQTQTVPITVTAPPITETVPRRTVTVTESTTVTITEPDFAEP